MDDIKSEEKHNSFPPSPFAKYKGELQLGGAAVDCYVLDTGERVISAGTTVKAIANTKSADLAEYIGVKALKPFINSDLVLAETIEFNMPGTHYVGRGITAERFIEICQAYVSALSAFVILLTFLSTNNTIYLLT
ncbi:MAG: hypothetical protein HQK77_16180 [Desulfobacterales bacterium]|nr:hypothetical protein [Desulfobacterales bacterium]